MVTPYPIVSTDRYTRIAARFLRRHPEMSRAYEKTLALLQVNPHHPSLRLHELDGSGCQADSRRSCFAGFAVSLSGKGANVEVRLRG